MLNDLNTEHKIIDGKGKNMDEIAGGGGERWSEDWGPEIITKEIVSRLKPDDKVLDLGSGDGRASHPFSLRGVEVVAVDYKKDRIEDGNEIRENADAKKVEEIIDDFTNLKRERLGNGASIILVSDALIHFIKKDADTFIKNLPNLFDPTKRGLLYINVPSTDCHTFKYYQYYNSRLIDSKTLEVECDCSGELRKEPIPFFEKGELQALLALQGANILATNELVRDTGAILHEVVAEFKPTK